MPVGRGVCVPTTQASDSPRAAIASRRSAPPDGADPAPVTAGEGAELPGLCAPPADPAVAQPVPRTATTAVAATITMPARRRCLLQGVCRPVLPMFLGRSRGTNVARLVHPTGCRPAD